MKSMLLSGVLLAALAGSAFAQANPVPVPTAPAAAGSTVQAPPPPPAARPGAMDDAGPGAPPPPDGPRGHRPPPPPSKAAHFRLERGDLALDVKCAEDEPMKACADIAMQMLDKAQSISKP